MRLTRLSCCLGMMSITLSSDDVGAQHRLGAFDRHGEVGAVKRPGSASYDATTQRYTLAGSGANMWGSEDAFHFAYRRLKGNVILTARAQLLGEGGEPHARWGGRSARASSPTRLTSPPRCTATGWWRCSTAVRGADRRKRCGRQ